ncbi:MAG TPA: hypothetical protein VFU23_07675 [Gemmatimonadales bacterium]|nr:hypothetical protein [Gemmatimonadales bacterium]
MGGPDARRWVTVLVVVGIALRFWAYAARPSLWLDEILLSRNIIDLPLIDLLTKPLLLDQVAPRGFLLVEKLFVLLLGPNEYALRLFPFLCAVAGMLSFRRLAERVLSGWAVPFAVALFALAIPFIKYGAEVKQYGVDSLAAILLVSLALDLRTREVSTRRRLAAGAAGFVVIWFSQASVLVMAGIGLGLALEWLAARNPQVRRVLFTTVPLWAAASGVAVVAGLRSMTPATREFMDDFWRSGFLPRPAGPSSLRWFWDQSLTMFTDPVLLRYRLPEVFLLVALLGLVLLLRRRRDAALLLLGPLLIGLLAAIAHQYPYRGRLLMYLIPGLLLAIAAGAEGIRRLVSRAHPALGGLAMAALLVLPTAALATTPPPYDIDHHRELLGYLQQHRQPGDAIWVFPLTRIGILFYGPRFGLRPGEWKTSVCDRTDTRAYLRDLDQYRGRPRLWVFSSTQRAFRSVRSAVRDYLGTIGVKRDSLALASLRHGTVYLELYDLSDTTRLAAARSEGFPVQPMATDPRPGCRPWTKD